MQMRVAADEGGELKKSTEKLRQELADARETLNRTKEALYCAQHELEWRLSAVRRCCSSSASKNASGSRLCLLVPAW